MQLISKLKSHENTNIKEFLSNPLLVSLLYKAYDYEPILPNKKHIFYRQVYDALFQQHDLSKDGGEFTRKKKANLDIDQFHIVLRAIGFVTVHAGKVEYGRDEFLNTFLGKVTNLCTGIEFSPSNLLDDLINQVPLFIKEGNHVRWAHKSLQEYFAAQYICVDAKAKEAEILNQLFESKKNTNYFNLLQLCYDIDYKTFRHTLIPRILRDVLSYVEVTYKNIDRAIIPEVQVLRRMGVTAFNHAVFMRIRPDTIKGIHSAETNATAHSQLMDVMQKAVELVASKGISQSGHTMSISDPTAFMFPRTPYNQFILSMIGKQGFGFLIQNPMGPRKFQELTDWPEEMILIDGETTNPLNTAQLFNSATDLIVSTAAIVADIQICREELKKLEEEIKAESETEFSF